jgi:tetratricopeptide (TPR) repeat protein/predicted aspartyl protease
MPKRVAAIKFVGASLFALSLGLWGEPALAGCTVGAMADLPVTMSAMRPLVQTKINGADALFIVDSGAFYSVITPASAEEHALRLGVAPYGLSMTGVGGEVSQLSIATVKTFTLADINLKNVDFFVGGSEVGAGAAGVIGQNVLGIADVEYDLAKGAIRLWKPHDCDGAMMAYWSKDQPYSAMDINEPTPLAPHTKGVAFVNGVRIRVIFDTGAASSFLTRHAAARAGFKPDGPGVVLAGFSRGVGRRAVKSWIAPFASFKIGDEEIRNTRLTVGDSDITDADMLIGADFFLSHHVYVAKTQRKIYFTYNGGPVFNLEGAPPSAPPIAPGPDKAAEPADAAPKPPGAADDTPTDAADFSRRGEAFAARRDFEHAFADLDRACALAPNDAQYVYQRGVARMANRQPFMAMADFNQALKLKPDDAPASLARAELRLAGRDKADAVKDLDVADRSSPKEADLRLSLAGDYERAGLFDQALIQFDLWVKAHPDDSRQPIGLNGRCWSRAQLGQDLDKALSDCNAALRLSPNAPVALSTRGLVHLRRGEFEKAIADYDAALTLQPKSAWSLYGRGLAKLKKGMTAEGQADIAAATALQPGLPGLAKARGIGV